MKSYIKATIEEFIMEKIEEAKRSLDDETREQYEEAYDEFCENILEE